MKWAESWPSPQPRTELDVLSIAAIPAVEKAEISLKHRKAARSPYLPRLYPKQPAPLATNQTFATDTVFGNLSDYGDSSQCGICLLQTTACP